jgi:hypothetical protein
VKVSGGNYDFLKDNCHNGTTKMVKLAKTPWYMMRWHRSKTTISPLDF